MHLAVIALIKNENPRKMGFNQVDIVCTKFFVPPEIFVKLQISARQRLPENSCEQIGKKAILNISCELSNDKKETEQNYEWSHLIFSGRMLSFFFFCFVYDSILVTNQTSYFTHSDGLDYGVVVKLMQSLKTEQNVNSKITQTHTRVDSFALKSWIGARRNAHNV